MACSVQYPPARPEGEHATPNTTTRGKLRSFPSTFLRLSMRQFKAVQEPQGAVTCYMV